MPSTKRKTQNLRIFTNALGDACDTHGVSTTELKTGQLKESVVRDVLQFTVNSMSRLGKYGGTTKFYNNTGSGGRVVVTDHADHRRKLARFLDRTIKSELPAVKCTLRWTELSDSVWVENLTQDTPPSGNDSSSGSEDGGTGTEGSSENSSDGTETSSESSSSSEGSDSDNSTESDTAPEPADPEQMEATERIEYESNKFSPDPENQQESEFDKWWRILAKLRQYCRDAAADGLPIDDFETYRPGIMGASMIREGITADACADAATAHWADDAREELGISKINPADVIPPLSPDTHPATGYLIRLLRARVPVMLHGGAGVGKTTLARTVADLYKLPFGMVSMTAGLSTTALTGSVNLKGFVSRPCIDTFTNGGVFLFDEMDAADPNLLLICNTMLANGEFQSPVTGERHLKHHEWFPIAAVNTLNGANTAYTGRSRLDHATMDRWRMGRIRLGFDTDLALKYALSELTETSNA